MTLQTSHTTRNDFWANGLATVGTVPSHRRRPSPMVVDCPSQTGVPPGSTRA